MKYEVSEEVRQIIISMCDMALKAGGGLNLKSVQKVLDIFGKDSDFPTPQQMQQQQQMSSVPPKEK